MGVRSKRFLCFILSMVMLLSCTVMVFATGGEDDGDPYNTLITTLRSGDYVCKTNSKHYKFAGNTYKKSGGGYYLYTELFDPNNSKDGELLYSDHLSKLTPSAKQAFLGDVLVIANAMSSDTENGYVVRNGDAVTADTVSDLMVVLQSQSGLGSQLLASLLQNTKPDYVTANRLYAPFSGIVGTALALISILIMSLLGLTMALDIAYITIPAFQLMLDGDVESGNGQGGKKGGMAKIISHEARSAVEAVENGGGQSGQGGSSNKAAIGIYFKRRWKGLVILGICLLYLVQGQIYVFVAWVIDLLSGFLGF